MNNGFADFNKGPIQYYPLHDYAKYVVNSPQNANGMAKYWAISYVVTFLLYMIFLFDGNNVMEQLFMSVFVSPGMLLILSTVISFFPSTYPKPKIEIDPEKKIITAIVSDCYRSFEGVRFNAEQNGIRTMYYTIIDCCYDGIRYRFERQSENSTINGKKPKKGDKMKLYLDVNYPERSLLADDIAHVENGACLVDRIFVLIIGIFWISVPLWPAILL